jgi:hypothetical protein
LFYSHSCRQKDLEQFLEHTRAKFVGFNVKNDTVCLAGLPQPIHEGVRVLKQHLYVSLAELQIQREEQIARNPISKVGGCFDLDSFRMCSMSITKMALG